MEFEFTMSKINRTEISWNEVYERLAYLPAGENKAYGIPRGGSVVAGLTGRAVDDPKDADFIVDDIRNSGKTAKEYEERFNLHVFTLFDKQTETRLKGKWVRFPWEEEPEIDIQSVVLRQLEFIGEDVEREGLRETPARVIRSWSKLYGGYDENPDDLIKVFDKEDYDEMVILRDVEFYSTCEHHLLPFFGRAHVAYIPSKKVIGVSKMARLLEIYSRRLQTQERLTEQVATFLMDRLKAQGAGCVLEASHLCMTARGVEKQRSKMVTSSLKGSFQNHEVREEFMRLIKNG